MTADSTSPAPPVDDEQPDTDGAYDYLLTMARQGCHCQPYSKPCPEHMMFADGVEAAFRWIDAHPPVRVQPDTDEPQEHWRCGRCGASPVAHAQGGTAEECIYSPILCDAGPARSELVALAKAQSEAARLRAVLVALVNAIGGDMDEILAAVDRARAALAAPTTKRRPTDDDAT